jgi:hypothetical protein
MNSNEHQNFASDGWYYQRRWLIRGLPGTLILQDGKLAFITVTAGRINSRLYASASGSEETIFETAVEKIDAVSSVWPTGALKVLVGTRRHIVSIVGPSAGSQGRGLAGVLAAAPTSRWWRGLLSDAGLRAPNTFFAGRVADGNDGASS